MSLITVYLLLLKATLTSFSGMTSLPLIRNDFVVERHAITDAQLNSAVAIARATPGPLGLYVVAVGYFAAGIPGAAAGCLAMITPAFLIILILRTIGRRAERDDVKRVIRGVILAAAGLVLSTMVPLAHDALASPLGILMALASFALLSFTRIDTVWVVLGSAALGLLFG
ncbi:MAG: chromate transporter [Bryobacteraceae bacterium]